MYATVLASHILHDGDRLQLLEISGGAPPKMTRYELTIARGTRSAVIDNPFYNLDVAMHAWLAKVAILASVNVPVSDLYL